MSFKHILQPKIQKHNNFRDYQIEADNAIYEELQNADKCIVKMFCGTGKSLLMRYCRVTQNQPLIVYVFPSLSLIDQFYSDYLTDILISHKIKISSENESTTDPAKIKAFLKKKFDNKIICITYQSFNTLLDNLDNNTIDVCIFDEAHHVVGEEIQKYIFSMTGTKQIFFTATPKNDNGIIMYDKENLNTNMCGKLVYDYSYLRGMNEEYLNPFEIRVDFYSENTNKSVYESIARAILISGNSRVLTFHSDVNTDRETTVSKFVNKLEFIKAFHYVCENEFSAKTKQYKEIEMIALDASISIKDRKDILKRFDTTPNNKVFIISSCETIGEGIDTKNANMCVFVDPKSSMVKIIQNIGRIVRKQKDVWKPASTILIPCRVDKTKYMECDGDREKCDAVIREDMGKSGNFNGILNVLSALKQEDEKLYDICLHYPDVFSPQELNNNANKQGFAIGEEPMELVESLEHLLDTDIEYGDEDESEEELLERVAEENDVCIEVHTNSLEEPVKKYGNSDNVIRMMIPYDEEDMEQYYPMVKKDGTKKNRDHFEKPKRENRIRLDVHTNPDIQVLWNVVDGMDLSKEICSCVIDCEVVDKDERWFERLEELKKFMDDKERRPKQKTLNIIEKNLGIWLRNQLANYERKTKSMHNELRYNEWSTFMNEYKDYFVQNTEKWEIKYNELIEYINTYDKLPRQSGSNNEYEKKLGKWLSHQKSNYKNKLDIMQIEEYYTKWKDFTNLYKQYFVSNNEIWNNKLLELKTFINNNKRKPLHTSNNIDEKNLGRWMSEQIKCFKNKSHGMIDDTRYNEWTQFIKEYEYYFISDEIKWQNYFEQTKKFIDTYNKRPSEVSKNEQEQNLGRWLQTQLRNYKNKTEGMKDETRYNEWTQFMEEYSDYILVDNRWNNNLNNLKLYINKNKKKPNQKSSDDFEKKLGLWLCVQLRTYKQRINGMQDETRYNTWTQFMEEYKEYFEKSKSSNLNINNTEPPEPMEPPPATPKSKPKSKSKKSMEYKPNPEQQEPLEPSETPEQHKQRVKSELSTMHQHFKTQTSANTHTEFQNDPELWNKYHAVSEQNEQSFPEHEIPRNRVIQELNKIKCKRAKTVVDMGCGKAQISQHFASDPRFKFINYDHVACNSNVQQCDISNIPLEDDSVEICILSLAMWGSNCKDYVKEAHRILETGGKLYIIEATKRWTTDETDPADRLKKLLIESGFRIDNSSIRKFCLFECSK